MNHPSLKAGHDGNAFPGPIAWMAQHSIAANLLMLLLIGGGIWTAFNIQKEVYPQFDLDIVNVSVSYPGAAPAEVEQGILRPVESAIRGIDGIKVISSTAREGSGSIRIELVWIVPIVGMSMDPGNVDQDIGAFADMAVPDRIILARGAAQCPSG